MSVMFTLVVFVVCLNILIATVRAAFLLIRQREESRKRQQLAEIIARYRDSDIEKTREE